MAQDGVLVIGPGGKMLQVGADQAADAADLGWVPANERQIADWKREQELQTPGQQAITALEAAGSAATLGASTHLETGFGLSTPERIAARARLNPVAHAVGTGAGVVLPAAIPGVGEYSATGLIARAGRGTSQALARLAPETVGIASRALAGPVPEGMGLLGRALGKAAYYGAGSAVEGTLWAAGQVVHESALDPRFSAENALHTLGLGAVLGGVLGGTLGAASEAIPAAISRGKDAILGIDRKPGLYARLVGTVRGEDPQTIQNIVASKGETLVHPEVRAKFAEELANGVNERLDADQMAQSAYADALSRRGHLPAGGYSGLAETLNPAENASRQIALEELRLMQEDAMWERMAASIIPKGERAATMGRSSFEHGGIQEFGQMIQRAEQGPYAALMTKVSKPEGGFTFNAVSGKEPTAGFVVSTHPERSLALDANTLKFTDLAGYVQKNADLLQQSGNHFGAWHDPESGKIFLDVSTVVPKAETAEALAKQNDQIAYFDLGSGKSVTVNREATSGGALLKGSHGQETGTPPSGTPPGPAAPSGPAGGAVPPPNGPQAQPRGTPKSGPAPIDTAGHKAEVDQLLAKFGTNGKIDPKKVDKFLRKSIESGEPIDTGILDSWQRSSNALHQQIEDAHKYLPTGIADREAIKSVVSKTADNVEKTRHQLALAKAVQRIGEPGEFGEKLMVAGELLGGGAELGLIPELGKIFGAAGAVLGPLHNIAAKGMNPTRIAEVLGWFERANTAAERALGRSISELMNPVGEAAIRGAGPTGADLSDRFNRNTRQLKMLAQDPDELMKRLDHATEHFAPHAPQIAQNFQIVTSSAVAFLSSKIPPKVKDGFLGHEMDPSPAAMRMFHRYYDAVQNPASVIRNPTPEGIEALQAVYPTFLQKARTAILDRVARTRQPIPYQSRLRIASVVGQPADWSMTPDGLRQLQLSLALSKGTPQPPPGSQPRGSAGGKAKALKYAKNSQTPAQASLDPNRK